MVGVLQVLIFIAVILVGGIFLQIFLSKQQNKWLGRILPILTFLFALLATLMYFLSFMAGTPLWQICVTLLLTFLLYNIPTLILYLIYRACQEKRMVHREIEKMSKQDL